jgi:hypothetical protein
VGGRAERGAHRSCDTSPAGEHFFRNVAHNAIARALEF